MPDHNFSHVKTAVRSVGSNHLACNMRTFAHVIYSACDHMLRLSPEKKALSIDSFLWHVFGVKFSIDPNLADGDFKALPMPDEPPLQETDRWDLK